MTFSCGKAGVHLAFQDHSHANTFHAFCDRLTPTTLRSEAIPSVDELQALGILLEEDITASYQRSYIASKPMKTCLFLFVDGSSADVEPQDMTLVRVNSLAGTLLGSVSFVESRATDKDEQDEQWFNDGWDSDTDISSLESSTDSDDDVQFYDAVECPKCSWFTLEV